MDREQLLRCWIESHRPACVCADPNWALIETPNLTHFGKVQCRSCHAFINWIRRYFSVVEPQA